METLYRLLNRISNWKTLLVLIAAYVVFPAYILKNTELKINELAKKPIGPIDLTFGFDPQHTLQMVADYGDTARAYYARGEMTADVIYPILYAFLFGVILTLLFRNKPYLPFKYMNVLPFWMMLFDFFENTFIVLLLYRYPEQSLVLATCCEIFKLLKWLTFIPIILAILYGLTRLFVGQKLSDNQ